MKKRVEREDILLALYGVGAPTERLDALASLLVDLMVEVEALRGAAVAAEGCERNESVRDGHDWACHDPTLTQGKGAYATAYVDAAYLRHNAAGVSGGIEKLLARFRPDDPVGAREQLMLKRLGFSDEEVGRFVVAAEEAAQFT